MSDPPERIGSGECAGWSTALKVCARWIALLVVVAACGDQSGSPDAERIPPGRGYEEVATALHGFIRSEMEHKDLPALSIALVDGREIVWAEGFGLAHPDEGLPATARTVYRVGSVSKLFTGLGILQFVERGEVDLDAPVIRYLPALAPMNSSDAAITLRDLMSHRSGLVREPPTGHYFDASHPSLEATVASLNRTELVYEPGTRTKYSNAGIAVVGYVLETLSGRPFAEHLKEAVLEPAGMSRSGFAPDAGLREELAEAYMWTYDGRRFEAPDFQLGMAPAGSMYASVLDLGRFLSVLFHGGEGPGGRVVSEAMLEEMWTPRDGPGTPGGRYGLGFAVGDLDGARMVGHGGAIYGFATRIAALPDDRFGVAVATTVDLANTVTDRIAETALRMMRAARAGQPLPVPRPTEPLDPTRARQLAGRYVAAERGVELEVHHGELHLVRDRGGVRERLQARGDTLVADGRLAYGTRVLPLTTEAGTPAVLLEGDTLRRVPDRRPDPAPERWNGLVGEYGWDHNTLYILEHGGRLYALIEWFFRYPLVEVSEDIFAFPAWGLYGSERVVFDRGDDGRTTRVVVAGVAFPRRNVGSEPGETFRIEPVRPMEELRAEALRAEPPREEGDFRQPDLVELRSLDPTIRYDIRYATTNNFLGSVFYREPRALLQRPAAEALARVHRRLSEQGFGLLVHDAYRPWHVTKMFFDATPEDRKLFVADPSRGSRHNRGAAVDLTLYELQTGEPAAMVSGYDEFSPRAYPEYPGGTSRQRWHRRLLRETMETEGFTVYEWEWWHFDHRDWRAYPILALTFDEIPE